VAIFGHRVGCHSGCDAYRSRCDNLAGK